MKNALKPLLLFIVIMILCCANAYGAEGNVINWNTLCTYGTVGLEDTRISLPFAVGNDVMYLPSSLSPDALPLFAEIPKGTNVKITGELGECEFYSGAIINLNKICSPNDYSVKLVATNATGTYEYRIKFLFSTNIPALYIISDNPVDNGRLWVEWSSDKSNKATGNMVMQKSNGQCVYNGALTQIKGRGNTTWQLEKKPYQIKLSEKVDLLESGNSDNKNKTWVLLANYIDSTSLRNTIALNIGKMSGMPSNIESRHVDLYYDGEYRGNYLLSEKVEVGKGRVDIANLEDENESANPGTVIEDLPIATAVTPNGATYTYCQGMLSPSDIRGGYLIEMDFEERALEEMCYFKTSHGQYVVVKNPEYASKEEMEYIAGLYQEYEDSIYNGGVNPYTGKLYSDYVDAQSVAKYLLVNELSKSRDCFKSSAYLHKDKDSDYMIMGPLWDYDMSFGRGGYDYNNIFDDTHGLKNITNDFVLRLLNIDSFYDTVRNVYNDSIYPYVKKYISSQAYINGQRSTSLLLYSDYIQASSENNCALWYPESNLSDEFTLMYNFISKRADNLYDIINPAPDISSQNTYLDVYPTDWHYKAVHEASRCGYVNGMGMKMFNPSGNVERVHLAQILYNIAGRVPTEYKTHYSDVSSSDWYAPALSWISENGINLWSNEAVFSGTTFITRAELVESLYRLSGCDNTYDEHVLGTFADKQVIASNQIPAFCWAVSVNIINGYEDGEIKPSRHLSRGELAAVLIRYNSAIAKNENTN